ncbi:PTS sugar transporter subunit IIA [Bacillus canaveralius]|uniref:PTS sugar transporter subunit IIA n=1 Tax=Bacillus canaveralius TaxID=1403243 RepID=UPI00163B5C03|nr:PTS sugar transporter subunit IIA [Bacillus canaveralius]
MSLLRLKKSVSFGEFKEITIMIVLAATQEKKHVRALSQLNKIMSDENNILTIHQAASAKEIYSLIESLSA